MIALDLDGTLLDYSPEGPTPHVNPAVIAALQARGVTAVGIVTNQGGLCFGVAGKLRKDGRPYPTPRQFATRLQAAVLALNEAGIRVVFVRVSCWHDAAARQPEIADAVQRAAREVRLWLAGLRALDWCVYTTAAARKPSPLMLRAVGATEYWGDSPEDAEAAHNAGVPFVHVERFL